MVCRWDGTVFAFLIGGLALACIMTLPGKADAAFEDLDEPGPYKVGYVDVNMTVTTVLDWKYSMVSTWGITWGMR